MNRVRNFGIMALVLLLFVAVFITVSLFSKEPQKAHDFTTGTYSGEVFSLFDNLGKQNTALIFIDPEIDGSNQVLEKLLKHKDEIDIVAVSVSKLSQNEQIKLIPADALSIKKLCFDGKEAIEKYNIGNAPITYFIDKKGYVVDAYVGSIKDESINKLIEKMA